MVRFHLGPPKELGHGWTRIDTDKAKEFFLSVYIRVHPWPKSAVRKLESLPIAEAIEIFDN